MINGVQYDDRELIYKNPDAIIKRSNDSRTCFEKDRSKIIHSAAFRCLQGKTQVFSPSHADFFRTRLTHCLETAQIGKGMALNLQIVDPDLIELACFVHDIGHPPFGHSGELALKRLMKDHGGFEGNAQNLRIIDKLEVKYKQCKGLNLTRASVDSILKYSKSYSDIKESNDKKISDWKFYYDDDESLVRWAKTGAPSIDDRSIECEIMEWADDIAYSTHDLEDGIKSQLISYDKLQQLESEIKSDLKNNKKYDCDIWEDVKNIIETLPRNSGKTHEELCNRKELIACLINDFIGNAKCIERSNCEDCDSRYKYTLSIDNNSVIKCEMLKTITRNLILNDPGLATLEKKGQIVIEKLFEILNEDDPYVNKIFPVDVRKSIKDGKHDRERIVCDYIVSMTDNHALKLYSRLIGPDVHSFFELN